MAVETIQQSPDAGRDAVLQSAAHPVTIRLGRLVQRGQQEDRMKTWLKRSALMLASAGHVIGYAQVGHAAAQAQYLGPAASAAKPSPATAAKATLAFQARASTISKVRGQVLTPQQLGRFGAAQQAQVRTSVDHLQRANATFQSKAAAMSPKQRLLAGLQVDLATSALRTASLVQSPGTPEAQMLLDGSTRLSIGADAAAKATGKPVHDVEVFVDPFGPKPAEPMDVYVLPIGLVEYPELLSTGQIVGTLDELKFNNPTSPARGEMVPGYIYAVWVGTRNAAAAMAQLVAQKKVKYHTIDTNDIQGAFTITFEAKERVVAP